MRQLPSDDARHNIDEFEVLVCEGIWPKVNKFLQSLPKTRAGREAAAYLLKLCGLAKQNYPLGGSLKDVQVLPPEIKSAFSSLQEALTASASGSSDDRATEGPKETLNGFTVREIEVYEITNAAKLGPEVYSSRTFVPVATVSTR